METNNQSHTIDTIDAVQILRAYELPGTEEYIYFDHATAGWYVIGARDMSRLATMLRERVRDAYSMWCAETTLEQATSDQLQSAGVEA